MDQIYREYSEKYMTDMGSYNINFKKSRKWDNC